MHLVFRHSTKTIISYQTCLSNTIWKFIHLTPIHSVRKPYSAKKSNRRNVQESAIAGILPHHSDISCNNFYGIEGDEGVIFVDDLNKSENSIIGALRVTEKPSPEFKILNFGAVRLDSENKPSYHAPYHEVRNKFELHNGTSMKHINIAAKKSNDFLKDETRRVDNLTESVPNNSESVCSVRSKNGEVYNTDIKDTSSKVFQNSQSTNYTLKDDSPSSNQKSYFGNDISLEENLTIKKPTVSFAGGVFFSEEYSKKSNDNFKNKQNEKKIDHFTKSEGSKTIYDFTSKDKDLFIKPCKDSLLPRNGNETPLLKDDLLNESYLKQHTIREGLEETSVKEITIVEQYFRKSDHVHKVNVRNAVEQSKMPYDNQSILFKRLQIPKNEISKKYDSQSSLRHKDVSVSSTSAESLKSLSKEDVTAYDFVKKIQITNKISDEVKQGISARKEKKLDIKGFRILKHQVPTLKYFTRDEILQLLKENVLYQDDDIVVLNKPYNLIIHESNTTQGNACLSNYLDDFAKLLDPSNSSPKLLTIHRLDKETTGCLLLARHDTSAIKLKSLFSERKIFKTYWIVTTNVPDPVEGVIDIPISEGKIDGKARMVLHPNLPDGTPYISHSKNGKRAVTQYSVIAESGNAALVEVKPQTGLKHQIRVHFGFGLGCPILGDHKYSHLDKLAPQKLPSDLLQKLKVRQTKVRHIPLHIHSKHILIPKYANERNLFVTAPLPKHIVENLRSLKFRK